MRRSGLSGYGLGGGGERGRRIVLVVVRSCALVYKGLVGFGGEGQGGILLYFACRGSYRDIENLVICWLVTGCTGMEP